MASKLNFESSFFNPFLLKDNSIYNEVDPGVNFFQDIPSLDIKYYSPPEVKENFKNFFEDAVSIFHFNIRSMKKNFDNLRDLNNALNFRLSLFAFLKRRPMMIVLVKIFLIILKTITLYTR